MTTKITALHKQLCFAIYSASHAFTRAYRPLLAPLDLTYPQYLVLLALWECDGMRVKEIGRELFLDSGTLTPLLKRLEALGLVRRVRDSGDERQVTILLTEAGRALEAAAAAIPGAMACMTSLAEDELADLTDRIVRLRASLREVGDNALVPA